MQWHGKEMLGFYFEIHWTNIETTINTSFPAIFNLGSTSKRYTKSSRCVTSQCHRCHWGRDIGKLVCQSRLRSSTCSFFINKLSSPEESVPAVWYHSQSMSWLQRMSHIAGIALDHLLVQLMKCGISTTWESLHRHTTTPERSRLLMNPVDHLFHDR